MLQPEKDSLERVIDEAARALRLIRSSLKIRVDLNTETDIKLKVKEFLFKEFPDCQGIFISALLLQSFAWSLRREMIEIEKEIEEGLSNMKDTFKI